MVAGLIPFTSCQKKPSEEGLKLGFLGKIENINPLGSKGELDQQVIEAVFRGAFQFNDKWEKIPALAKKLPSTEDKTLQYAGQSVIKVTFQLRDGANWSNETPITSNDFLFTYQLALSPIFQNFNQDWLAGIKRVKAIDEKKIEFSLDPTRRDFNVTPLPEKVLANVVTRVPLQRVDDVFRKKTAFSGPYVLKSFSPRKVILEKNLQFYLPVRIKRLELNFYHRKMDMVEDLKKGKIHLAYGLGLEDVEPLKGNKDLKVYVGPSQGIRVLVPNHDNHLFEDKNFRKALLLAANPRRISNDIYDTEDFAALSWLSSRHQAYIPVLDRYKTSPSEIEKYLKAAKFTRVDGQWLRQGEEVNLTLLISAADREAFKIAESIRTKLANLGINLEIIPYPREVYQQYVSKRKFHDLAMVTIKTPPTVRIGPIFKSTAYPNPKNRFTGKNFGGWDNEIYDNLSIIMDKSLSRKKRIEVLKRHQKIFAEELPYIPLVNKAEIVIYNKQLKGISPRGFGALTWNVQEWRVGKK